MALAKDAHLEVVPLLDEGAVGVVLSGDAVSFDTGRTVGRALPANNTRRLVSFEGISTGEGLFPTTAQTKVRRLLNYFHAGGALRVYRKYPTVLTAWSTSNPEGYDDIVPLDSGAGDYSWFDATMTRHTFKVEGVTLGN